MDAYITEQEQIEKIKAFIRNYATTIVVSVCLVMAASFGFRYWQQQTEKHYAQAVTGYELMFINYKSNDLQTARLQAERLQTQYSKTPYASLAALFLAGDAVNSGNLDKAITELSWVMQHSKESSLREIARTRQARILLAQGKPKDALSLLKTVDNTHFSSLVEGVKGDAFALLGEENAARAAYESALQHLPSDSQSRALLQMKLANLVAGINSQTVPVA